MLVSVVSCAPVGIEGSVVRVEVDLPRGIPGVDVVGLPDSAVREARERVKAAIRNSGFVFPRERVLINLAPAGIRKVGASFDLAIALAVLASTEQVPYERLARTMVLGELLLSGNVQPINGVLSAVAAGLREGIDRFLVPRPNLREALALEQGNIFPVSTLEEAVTQLCRPLRSCRQPELEAPVPLADPVVRHGDLADLRGHAQLRRALEIAAAGRHNLFLCGPVGCGKTMAARRMAGILPELTRDEALEVTRIHSVAGVLPPHGGLMRTRPFRTPHHSASKEGITGGGRLVGPGEVSLAHKGVLFLDEVLEFGPGLLQSLREPSEDGQITIARAGQSVRYPARFQLVMTANACPCGRLGADNKACICEDEAVVRYWKRMGDSLLDRVDIRVLVKRVSSAELTGPKGEGSLAVRERVHGAFALQQRRYAGKPWGWNAELPPGLLDRYCAMTPEASDKYAHEIEVKALSARACHAIVKVARTIADLAGRSLLEQSDIEEAVALRQMGDGAKYFPAVVDQV